MQEKTHKIKHFFTWLDNNILLLLAGFLLAFIPLYPKLPLFDAIPGYIVRVRLEDILIFVTFIIWGIQTLRGKVKWKTPLLLAISAYILVGLLSLLSGMFIIKTIPLEMLHIGKSTLHYFRYIEYFSIFLIIFSAIKTKKDAKILLITFILTTLAISVYGYGQKKFYWPLYSTMNREFSKGERLYLTEHARLQSTFGGHYDLAAFMVIALPLLLAFFLSTKKKVLKIALALISIGGLWTLILSASRASFIAYLVASYVVILFFAIAKKSLWKKFSYLISRSFLFTFFIFLMMMVYGAGMYERLLHVLEGYPQAHYMYHTANHKQKMFYQGILVSAGLMEINDEKEKDMGVLVSTDERPVSVKPSDVYVDVPDQVIVATTSAEGVESITFVERDRTWSDNALKYGLSFAIRLDTLWPNAITGLERNPLVGSGYATLNKEGATHFTEADSTDNNYLRTLGETGILGFLSFYGIIIIAMIMAFKEHRNDDPFVSSLAIGFFAASLGLLLNATYIDVYAASKVAFTYWGITGVLAGVYYLSREPSFILKSERAQVKLDAEKVIPEETKPKKASNKKKTTSKTKKSVSKRPIKKTSKKKSKKKK